MNEVQWSEEELGVKQMAEKVGLVLVKVRTGNSKKKYTRYKLRGEAGFVQTVTLDPKHLDDRDHESHDESVAVMTLDEASETIDDLIRIEEWQPTDLEFGELLDFFAANSSGAMTRAERLELLKQMDNQVLDLMLRLARGEAARLRSQECH
jgi:hypothetical protein